MVKTHKVITEFRNHERAKEYVCENYEVKQDPLDKYAVSVPDKSHSSPALSYLVEDQSIRFVHAVTTGHVIVRCDRDTGMGSGPHSDQESRNHRGGHPR